MTCHFPDFGSASERSCCEGNSLQPIKSTTRICLITRHQHGISALVPKMSFRGETWGVVAISRLFSQARAMSKWWILNHGMKKRKGPINTDTKKLTKIGFVQSILNILWSQFLPANLWGHEQLYPPLVFWQRPPFLQGFKAAHSSTSERKEK